jgi:hypothetical protein
LRIAIGYEIKFVEIGLDGDHICPLIQSIPTMAANNIVKIIKGILASKENKRCFGLGVV